jgi:hypothetical protein
VVNGDTPFQMLFDAAVKLGFTLRLEGDAIRVAWPITPEAARIASALKPRKPELLAHLRRAAAGTGDAPSDPMPPDIIWVKRHHLGDPTDPLFGTVEIVEAATPAPGQALDRTQNPQTKPPLPETLWRAFTTFAAARSYQLEQARVYLTAGGYDDRIDRYYVAAPASWQAAPPHGSAALPSAVCTQ